MIIEHKKIEHKGKKIFEKIVISSNFKKVPKYLSEDEACFLFLNNGSFQFRTPTNVLACNKNEAMLAKCGNYFIEQVSVNKNIKEEDVSVVGAFFYPDMIKELFGTDLSVEHFQSNFDVLKVNVEPLMKSFIDSINFLLDNPEVVDENIINNKLKEILIILSKSENASSINSFVSSLFVPHEYNFNEIIQNNLYSNLSINDFSTLCSCSVATFKRKFQELYKQSPAKYISIKKLERASQLLRIKSKSIADVAYECGFETTSNFNRAFKRYFNKTPSQYRLS